MTVWIAQCLCPARHCIVAAVGEADNLDAAETEVARPLRERIDRLLSEHAINPWCGICGSTDWHVELGRTVFATLAEALPMLRETEQQNAAARALLGDRLRRQRPN